MKSKPKANRPPRSGTRARSPYHTPKLVAYGDVRRLTDSVTQKGTVVDGMIGYISLKT